MTSESRGMWIGGEHVVADRWIESFDPATEEVIGRVPAGGAAQVDRAVAAAKAAFDDWRYLAANDRAELLHEAYARSMAHHGELVELLTREQGKPRPEQEEEAEWALTSLRYYAELGRNGLGRVVPSAEPRTQLNLVLKEPYGVVGAIVPWNYPLLLLGWKLAPALAAGNTVVVKPSELTSLVTLEWIERCFDHFPPGVVNVVTGSGAEAGEALVRHPDVRVVAMTGSVATGQRIASVAAPLMKHLHLELGGKDAFVVAPDAELEPAADALAYSALLNSGQVCTSSERVFVPAARREEFAEALTAKVGELRLGHGLDAGTDLGPLADAAFRDKVDAHVRDAVDRGARVLTGGQRPDRRGWFYEPTVLVDVDDDMVIMTEETFGPTIPVATYDGFDEVIDRVNASELGLGATLRSSDPLLIKRFYERVKAGTVWINDPLTDNYAGPFGGMKMTGGGRELGPEGLETFLETKHVHWDFDQASKDWWFPYR
ncbi:aldehyde dehydrogenase family protein [Egicoccus halophilus]|uniref:Aldehyde dehydrogenase n=1 Tax=Egicoccus halophilus TaxID=1670830 RepID=A0A8J3A8E1_9ACTN|nr:aldehyde dehydrogenase family protein [Egicoccus halophilus]GGI04074.1 aldehyde dehydrogenase [Egicoccus halophilus]